MDSNGWIRIGLPGEKWKIKRRKQFDNGRVMHNKQSKNINPVKFVSNY